ncbi:MAG: ABC transporter permease [Acidobacteriota bacterium]|nr:ABC transporter permease [Acidobacteriota bacterium]
MSAGGPPIPPQVEHEPGRGPGVGTAPTPGTAAPGTPEPTATPAPSASLAAKLRRAATSTSGSMPIFLALVGIIVVFAIMKPSAFLGSYNIKSIFIDASVALTLSVGMTYVIITAGIDLSVGSVLVFSGVIALKVMTGLAGGAVASANAGWGIIAVGIVAGLAVGAGWGILNGLLIALLDLPPLIVTLGSFGAALGLSDVLTGGVDLSGVPNALGNSIGAGNVGPIPALVLIAGIVAIVLGLVLHTTRFGRYTYAIGSNAEAARRAGINVNRHLIKIYALAGLLSGLGGVLSLAYFTTTTISGHETDNLTAIAAVVIGGTSLFGGVGAMAGTVVGVFIPVVLASGLVIVGVQSFWQQVMIGVILVAAVYFDQLRRRARARA